MASAAQKAQQGKMKACAIDWRNDMSNRSYRSFIKDCLATGASSKSKKRRNKRRMKRSRR